MISPKVLWYTHSESKNDDSAWNSTLHHWNVLLINRKDRIHSILDRLYIKAKPIIDPITISEGKIPESKFRYLLVSFDSTGTSPNDLKWDLIYKGIVRKNELLRQRERRDGLANYVDSHIQELTR